MTALFAALLFLFSAQDDLDGAIKDLSQKLSPEGLSGRLAQAAAQPWGLQAVKEKIEFLLGGRTSRFERDPLRYYEEYLFSTDPAGDLHLRPERKAEADRLAGLMTHAGDSMKDFNRRADLLVGQIEPATDFEKRAKDSWKDPGFRLAFFHRHPAELRQLSAAEIADVLVLRGLEPGNAGKLRVGGPYADELRSRLEQTQGALDMIKAYEKPYLQEAARVKEAGPRAVVTSDAGILVLLGRLLRQAQEGGPESIGGITEGDEAKGKPAVVSFNLDLDEFAPLVKEAESVASGLGALFEQAAARLAGETEEEKKVIEFLKSTRVRLLLAERAMALRKEQELKAEEIMNAVIADGFDEKDGKLRVKKGRYQNDQKVDSVEALGSELDNVVEEFNGSIRQDFDRIAERCLDERVIALFENRGGTFLLMEHRDFVIASAVEAVKRQGLDVFVKTYLVQKGDRYEVRPERSRRVQAILDRAQVIKKETEKPEK
ncbi:MAG TPA: hypothetical protein VEN81_08585 [Planctomycetota bacterium]|nr:hypothetical protein [Planctomycetota bacterium]